VRRLRSTYGIGEFLEIDNVMQKVIDARYIHYPKVDGKEIYEWQYKFSDRCGWTSEDALVKKLGYEEGRLYTKRLKFDYMTGDSQCRYIGFKDEDGTELIWQTTAYNDTMRNFKKDAWYRFKIKCKDPKRGLCIWWVALIRWEGAT
jgi:hypothetical protein